MNLEEALEEIQKLQRVIEDLRKENAELRRGLTVVVSDDDVCAICLEGFECGRGSCVRPRTCNHLFHKNCFAQIRPSTRVCPCCRVPAPLSQYVWVTRKCGDGG